MKKYPEHAKIDKDKAETVNEVLDFVLELGDRFSMMSHRDMFAEFFGANESVLEQERMMMMRELISQDCQESISIG